MPRLFREAPLNSIWEGSGNVNALDVLRAMVRTPAAVDAFFDEVGLAAGAEPRLDAYVADVKRDLGDLEQIEFRARRLVERMALALQASVLVRFGDPAVADAFCATRLAGDHGRSLGTLPAGIDYRAIIERHRPQL
jgi:putative acyl-CoA dehydrogenase